MVMFEELVDNVLMDIGDIGKPMGQPAAGMHEHGFFAHDDMTKPLRFSDNARRGKKTRSLSLGEKEGKKPVSSLISKVSGTHSAA